MDFAQLGIKLDTKDLEKGLQQLKQLQPTGVGAAAAADKLSKSLSRTALAQERLAISTAKANKASAMEAIASGKLSKSKIMEQQAIIKAADAQIKASAAKSAHIKKLRDEIALQKQLVGATNAATAATAKNNAQLVGVAGRFAGSGGRGAMVANDPANDTAPNRFNTANIAAQFQDIGVTASMGMNPMTIALQQGTQLSAILNSMSGSPLKGLAQAFTSIINPISLVSIGLVGLIAAGIQFVDWASVAQSGASILAKAFDFLAENAGVLTLSLATLTVTVIALKFTSIIAGVTTLIPAMIGLAAAAWAAIVPILAMAAPFLAAAAAAAAFGGVMYALFGDQFVEAIRTGVNTAIGLVVGLVKTITRLFQDGQLRESIIGLLVSPISLASDAAKTALNFFIKGINDLINKLPDWVTDRTGISKIDFQFEISNKSREMAIGGASDLAKAINDEFVRSVVDVDYVGEISTKVQEGFKFTADKLRGFSKGLTDSIEDGKVKENPYVEIIANAQKRIDLLKMERQAIGMTEQAANRLRIETELLADANEKIDNLKPEQILKLKQIASETAALEEQNKRLSESYDFLRDTGKGFFQDLRGNIREGESLWDSFANAAINALNRIADKLADAAFDNLLNGFSGGGQSSSGNFLGSLASTVSSFLFNAEGNAFTPNGVEQFAKGGTFTNSLVKSPTMFTFANGGKFGVMGEAGPEAVMPLHRGSDGSLGVKVSDNGGQSSNSTVINIDARGAEKGVEEKIRNVMNEVMTLRKDVPKIAMSSVVSANNRNLRFL